ncbi:hypothetical protein [Streptomyces sp. NPDC047071]|uniref:hypothetical protein n=1 Tax=unclassified Streptomyces TaxID=2593676 RepID=UPI00345537C6
MSYRPSNPPARCIKCGDVHLILSQAVNPRTGEVEYRFTCLDCRVAWPQDQHGGAPDDYA